MKSTVLLILTWMERNGTIQLCWSFLYTFQTLFSVIVRHFFRYPLLNLTVLLQKSITLANSSLRRLPCQSAKNSSVVCGLFK